MSSRWTVCDRIVKFVSVASVIAIFLTFTLPVLPSKADLKGENVIDRPPNAVTSDALPTTQMDGIAWDQLIVDGRVFAGGEFANARPAGSLPGVNEVPRSNLLAYNLSTGALDESFAPVINGKVKSLAVSPDKSRLFIGGNFTQVNGKRRNRIAAFKLPEGTLDENFKPDVNNQVEAITLNASTVYFGGHFSMVDGVERTRLAAVDIASGVLTGWSPTADYYLSGMAITPDGSKIALGGSFSNINGALNRGLAFVNVADGALTQFAANQTVENYGMNAGFLGIKNDGKNILVTGWWAGGKGGNFEGVLSADPVTGAIRWMADCHGDSYDATTMGGVTYTVSHSHTCSNMGAYPEQPARTYQRANAFLDQATTTTKHDSQGYKDFFGQPAPTQINWYPQFEAGNVSGAWQAAWSAESDGNYLVLGGEFLRVNGVRQQGLVRFARPGIAPSKKAPSLSDEWNPSAVLSGANIRVSWSANYDTDNMNLTYKLYRSDKPGVPLATVEASSTWWNTPRMFWTDSDVVQGQSYTYKVSARDPDGNLAISNTVTLIAGSDSIPTTNYSQEVSRDGADHYWRLLEQPGSRTSTDWRGSNDLVLGKDVSLGQPGAMAEVQDTAAELSGTSRSVSGALSPEPATSAYSVELWFKTTATAAGKILGFGKALDNNKWEYERYVGMSANGRILFEVNQEIPKTISTSASYNDGKWHHLVASLSEAGQVLWIDGRAVAANPGVVSVDLNRNGYWRLGGDPVPARPGVGSTYPYFAGTIDEVSTYHVSLTKDQIRRHYTASGRALNLPPAPSDVYGKAVIADFPSFYWRMNESQGGTATDATDNLANGTYFGQPTFGIPGQVAEGSSVKFTAGAGVSSDALLSAPKTFSMETWFQTRSTAGGVLMNFGSDASGLSETHDRQIWMDGSGRLRFRASTAQAGEITSQPGFNDDKWHYVVATTGPEGSALHIDGVQIGATPSTVVDSYMGHWRIGGDSSWEGQPWFDGSLDEAAVYSGVLSTDQIRAHYRGSVASSNHLPQPTFTVSCVQETCHFDGSASIDPDGKVGSYTWDFGDGTKSGGVTASRTYTASGTYKVTLTVIDDQRGVAETSKDVSVVLNNVLPVAAFTARCDGLKCSFDGSGSTDADGTVSSYSWDFGDGSTGSGAVVEHAFATPGLRKITLKVTDDRHGENSLTQDVSVVLNNVLPVAAFTARCDGLKCSFDGSSSTDADGTISSYSWDFGDGATGKGITAEHVFASSGVRKVTLSVVDNGGGQGSSSQDVSVLAANVLPVAAFTARCDGLKCSFDGSGSADADGTISSYSWDFGDGATGKGITAEHVFASSGVYKVTLSVVDDRGGESSKVLEIPVNQEPQMIGQEFAKEGQGWGRTDTGELWTYPMGATSFFVGGGQGHAEMVAARARRAVLSDVRVLDSTFKIDLSLDKIPVGSGAYTTLLSRYQANGWYGLGVRWLPNGSYSLIVYRTVNGETTTLKEAMTGGARYTPGTVMHVKFSTKGQGTTTLSGKAWIGDSPEPNAPQVTATDSTAVLQEAGGVGINAYLSGLATNAPIVLGVDNLMLTKD